MRGGIKTVGRLRTYNDQELRQIRCLGQKSLDEIKSSLAELSASNCNNEAGVVNAERQTLKERLITDIGTIRAAHAKTRMWDSDERIAEYLLAKGWTMPTQEPSKNDVNRIHIGQDKNDAFFGVGDVIKGVFPNGTTFEGEITCIDIKKEGAALHTVIDYKFPAKPGEPNQGSVWLENLIVLEIIRFKAEGNHYI